MEHETLLRLTDLPGRVPRLAVLQAPAIRGISDRANGRLEMLRARRRRILPFRS